MTIQVALPIGDEILEQVALAVRDGLAARPKTLPAWLFYDQAGSALFEQITELNEYYLTRTERSIFREHGPEILSLAGEGRRLRIVELGAGSAEKTRLLLEAALDRQGSVVYEPIDVSATALEAARERLERELPEVEIEPRVMDYTRELELLPVDSDERQLVLYIGSSIGNFEPVEAIHLLRRVGGRLRPGDCLLLGLDLHKDLETLIAAYNDAAGVTAEFNLNVLRRLNRELGADFELETFAHRAVWNEGASRIEMHLESRIDQRVRVAALDLEIDFAAGETIHTENSYKFPAGGAEAMLFAAGFTPVATWTDSRQWFAVSLGRVEE